MRETMRRILGGVMVLAGLIGLAVGVYGTIWLQQAAGRLEQNVVSGMDFGLESLEVVSGTLQIIVQTVDDTSTVVDGAVASSQRTAETLDAVRPAIQELSDIVAFEIPNNIYAIQATMPALEQAGAAIDTTLRTLSRFQWSATVPVINYELGFGLGVDYDPPVPLQESIVEVNEALGDIPAHMIGIQASLLDTHHSLGDTVTSVEEVGESLSTVSRDLHATADVLKEYDDLVRRATDQVRAVRRNIRRQIGNARITLTVVLVWLVLSQAAPLYLGCTLAQRTAPAVAPDAPAEEQEQPTPTEPGPEPESEDHRD